MTKSDPTKDPEFQKVVRHFLTTPPQPHKPFGKAKPKKSPMAENPNVKLWERVFELRPLVSVDLRDPPQTETASSLSTELPSREDNPPASAECRNPQDAPTYRLIGRTWDGSYLMVVEHSQ